MLPVFHTPPPTLPIDQEFGSPELLRLSKS